MSRFIRATVAFGGPPITTSVVPLSTKRLLPPRGVAAGCLDHPRDVAEAAHSDRRHAVGRRAARSGGNCLRDRKLERDRDGYDDARGGGLLRVRIGVQARLLRRVHRRGPGGHRPARTGAASLVGRARVRDDSLSKVQAQGASDHRVGRALLRKLGARLRRQRPRGYGCGRRSGQQRQQGADAQGFRGFHRRHEG